MEPFASVMQLCELINGITIEDTNGKIKFLVPRMFRGELVDRLVQTAVFGSSEKLRQIAAYIIHSAANNHGIWCDSLNPVIGSAEGKKQDFTIAAFNIRGITYQTALVIFRVANRNKAGPFIFELTPQEMKHTKQSPAEFASCILGAALRTGYKGPIFIQCNGLNPHEPADSKGNGAQLITRCIEAGFHNFDLDCPVSEKNMELSAKALRIIRENQSEAIPVSIGCRLSGSNGKRISIAVYRNFLQDLNSQTGKQLDGINKIGVEITDVTLEKQTAESAPVVLDYDYLRKLSKMAREEFHLGGVVIHSALSSDPPDNLPDSGIIELQLSAELQNTIFDHSAFPIGLREEMYSYLVTNYSDDRKKDEHSDEFHFRLREALWGHFKKELWALDNQTKSVIFRAIESQILTYFQSLNLIGKRNWMNSLYNTPKAFPQSVPKEIFGSITS